ncbi:MAG: AlpA family phage regulatory protein [Gammaproteobacteria bacterium]|nr:AlpA family phage regulatory protein [Gammaproteobacteria bacterium]
MLKLKAVKEMTGLSRSTLYAYIEMGKFPRQVKLGERCVAWVEEEVATWLEARITERDASNSGNY